ncbi:MAG: hypothetical protein ISQ11_04195 [Planctomycetes bacterium]|nr:hypothetical protein [Planctomycetota bacterium]
MTTVTSAGAPPSSHRRAWDPTLLVYGATCGWVAIWIAAGPDARPNLFFREGGPIDLLNSAWLVGAAAMFWLARAARARSSLGTFWGVAALGLLLLGIDERFQAHELISRELDVPAPLGMRNWSDVVVLAYAAIAAGLLLWRWGELWGARRLRWLGIVALGLAAVSTGIDSVFPSSGAKDLWEESFKVLSGAGLVTVSLEALRMARAPREPGVGPGAPAGPSMAIPVLTAILALATATLIPDERWSELLSTNWGSPEAWLVCVLLWVAALPLLVVLPIQQATGHEPRAAGEEERGLGVVPRTLGVYLAILGCGEGLAATRFRLLDDLVADQFPATAAEELAFMHAPIAVPGLIFLLSATAMAVILICGRKLPGRFLGLSLSGLALLCLALIVNQLGGEASDALVAPGLRLAGATCFLLGSLSLTTTDRA